MRYLFILLACIAFQAQSQSYTVIHVIGKIYDSSADKYLIKGSKVAESASLKFESNGARAAVLSSSRGRFVIQQNSKASTKSDALYALSSVISPVRGRLSTRAGSINNALDFKKHFNEGTVALVGNAYTVSVSPSSYAMSESKFFYAQYQYNGETINKKLANDGDMLIIDVKGFYSVDGVAIDPAKVDKIKLYFFKAEDQTSAFITDMDLVVVSNEVLKSLLAQFSEDKEAAVLEVVNSMYGKCDEEDLKKAIAQL